MEVKMAIDGRIFVESGNKIGHYLENEEEEKRAGTKV